MEGRCECRKRVGFACDDVCYQRKGDDWYDLQDCLADCWFFRDRACSWWQRLRVWAGLARSECME